MAKLSLSRAWEESRSLLGRDGKLHAAVALALFALPATAFGTLAPAALMGGAPADGRTQLLFLLVMLLNLAGRLAISRLALGQASVGEAISDGLKRLPSAAAAFILFMLPLVVLLTPFLPAVMASPQSPPPGPLLASTGLVLLGFVLGVRLVLLLVPTAAAEKLGPLALLRRCWALSKGNWWRLAAFLITFFTAGILAARAIGYALGGSLILLAGPLEPMSVSALVLSAALALVGAAFTTVFSVMLARIYLQLAGPAHADVSVPTSGT